MKQKQYYNKFNKDFKNGAYQKQILKKKRNPVNLAVFAGYIKIKTKT